MKGRLTKEVKESNKRERKLVKEKSSAEPESNRTPARGM